MRIFLLGLLAGAIIAVLVMGVALVSMGNPYGSKIAVVRITGTISSSPSLLEETVSPSDVIPILESIDADPSVRGVLFEINSPGGSVVASRELSMAVRDMRKPTVCWMGDLAASGAYWIASACDTIVADPLTLTGSIGVTASYLQFVGTMEKYGVEYKRFVSGEAKDAGSPFRNMTADEERAMMAMVNETFRYFLEDVAGNRHLNESSIEAVRDGSLFLGKDAIGLMLVDMLGTWKDAKSAALDAAGLEEAQFVETQKSGLSIFDLISGFG